MSDLYWLTDEQMASLQPYFPKSHGRERVDDRRVLSGIIFVNRNGLRWRDAPREYRRAKGTPLHDGARLIGHAPLRCARRREGGARPEARAAQSISYSEVSGGDQLRFLKRQLSLPVSTISQ